MADINELVKTPMILLEDIVRACYDPRDFPVKWRIISGSFIGCTLKYELTDVACNIRISGLGDNAGIFQDRFGRSFSNVLIGIANRPNCEVEFLQ
jgi:hypothetical protein